MDLHTEENQLKQGHCVGALNRTYDASNLSPPEAVDGEQTLEAPLIQENGEPTGEYGRVGCCHPSSRIHRAFVLVFMCLLAFGSYYCYDNPAGLMNEIIRDMNISQTKYYSLYSFYSYPNVILCFFGGFLLDSVFGIRMGALLFASITFLGQVIVALGALFDNIYLMVFGRFVFGIGGESLAVAQNTYAVLWFKGKELNTVFGIQLSIARLGSMMNFETILYVYDYVQKSYKGYTGLGLTLMLASVLCLFSVLCALILAFFDKRAERLLNRASTRTEEVINLKDVLHFPLQFWLLCLICVLYYVSIFPFISGAKPFLMDKYNVSEKTASSITGVPYTVSAIVSPLCGLLCDFFGLNLIWTIFATILSATCHIFFAYVPASFVAPEVIMGVLGLGFSFLACAFWPMVALLVPEHQLGTAYGVMQALQNLGLAVVSQGTGTIKENFGYGGLELYFLTWISLSILAAVILQVQNVSSKGVLNPPLYRKNLCCWPSDPDNEGYPRHED